MKTIKNNKHFIIVWFLLIYYIVRYLIIGVDFNQPMILIKELSYGADMMAFLSLYLLIIWSLATENFKNTLYIIKQSFTWKK